MRKGKVIITAMLLTLFLVGCGSQSNYVDIKWFEYNSFSNAHSGDIKLKVGYIVTSCEVDYENNVVVMKIEKE